MTWSITFFCFFMYGKKKKKMFGQMVIFFFLFSWIFSSSTVGRKGRSWCTCRKKKGQKLWLWIKKKKVEEYHVLPLSKDFFLGGGGGISFFLARLVFACDDSLSLAVDSFFISPPPSVRSWAQSKSMLREWPLLAIASASKRRRELSSSMHNPVSPKAKFSFIYYLFKHHFKS